MRWDGHQVKCVEANGHRRASSIKSLGRNLGHLLQMKMIRGSAQGNTWMGSRWRLCCRVKQGVQTKGSSEEGDWVILHLRKLALSPVVVHSAVSDSLQPLGLLHAGLACPPVSPRTHSNSCPSSRRWCHPTISPSVVPFSTCLQCFPAPGSFPLH